MKKRISPLALGALLAVGMLAASCDSKLCYCYLYSSNAVPAVQENYVNSDTPCSSLTREPSRVCVERNEYIDPNGIAYVNPPSNE